MLDTTELGAGSYPEAPEPDYKCYKVKVSASSEIEYIVYASDENEAEHLIMNGYWDDVDTEKKKIEEILNIEEIQN